MRSTAQQYYAVAQEHLKRAKELYDAEDYFLSYYLSGLAVECLLRAFVVGKALVKWDLTVGMT